MQKLAGIASELMNTNTTPANIPSQEPVPDANADFMRQLTPALSVIAQSSRNTGNPERVQLLAALKPFLSPHTRKQIDHAEHLLRMARMAQAATEQLIPQILGGREV